MMWANHDSQSEHAVIFQEENAETEKTFQPFPPDMLVNKQPDELPEGVDPSEKEVCEFAGAYHSKV